MLSNILGHTSLPVSIFMGTVYFALHFPLGEAVRALVEHAVESVGAERLADGDVVFLLPAEIVEAEGGKDALIDPGDVQLRNIVGREQTLHLR